MFGGRDARKWLERWRRALDAATERLRAKLAGILRRMNLAAVDDAQGGRTTRLANDAIQATIDHGRQLGIEAAILAHTEATVLFDGKPIPFDDGERLWTAPPRREFLEAMDSRLEPAVLERYPLIEAAVLRQIIEARRTAARVVATMPLEDEAVIRAEIEGRVVNNARIAARVIAETETHAVAMRAQKEAVDALGLPVRWKTWWATNDHRTRPTHVDAHGQRVPIDQPFSVGAYQLMLPGDTSLGAGPEEVINCLLPHTRVADIGIKAAVSHHYSGEVIHILCADGTQIAVTPDHKIPTNRGWVRAKEINEGDKAFHVCGRNGMLVPEIDDISASAHELYAAHHKLSERRWSGRAYVNFDGNVSAKHVNVVFANRCLRFRVKPAFLQEINDILLKFSNIAKSLAVRNGFTNGRKNIARLVADGIMCGGKTIETLLFGGLGVVAPHALGCSWNAQAKINQACFDEIPRSADFSRDGIDAESFIIEPLDFIKIGKPDGLFSISAIEVVHVSNSYYEGPVYDFETDSGLIIAGGMIVSNCRCGVIYDID